MTQLVESKTKATQSSCLNNKSGQQQGSLSISTETVVRETKKEAFRPLEGKEEVLPLDNSAPTSSPGRGAVTGLPGRHGPVCPCLEQVARVLWL